MFRASVSMPLLPLPQLPRLFLFPATLLALALASAPRADDYDPPDRVARLRFLQGSVSFQPAGDSDWVAAVVNRPTTTGDRLWTDSGARAELSLGSATLRLAGTTGFSFLNLDDRTVQIELTQGTLDVRVQRLGRDEIFEVDTPNQAFTIQRPGRYRVEVGGDGYRTLVTVREGAGEATGAGRTYAVLAGETATFTGTDDLRGDIADAGGPDDFEDWGRARDRRDDGSASARFVSRDVVGYEDLDDYGAWRADPGYGNVWVPTRVAAGWAPYREGHWAWVAPWGWTWIDDEPWGYAPFHYGRWVHFGGSWGWVPGPITVQAVYAPALVAFIGGPGFGLAVSVGGGYSGNVAWFPLAPREVYVPAYHVSPGYVNRVNVSNTTVSSTTITTVYNTQVTSNYRTTNVTYVNRTVPGGVTAVPNHAFTGALPVARAAIAIDARQIASAPVDARAAVAPTRASVLGLHARTASNAARPPPVIAARSVVARVAPPPPPVPFSRQQEVLAAHPGQPLARHEVERLRPADRASERPLVRQAPPASAAPPERRQPAGQPAGQPAAPRAQPQPSAQPPAPPPVERREPRSERPPATQPSAQPRPQAQPQPQARPQPRRVEPLAQPLQQQSPPAQPPQPQQPQPLQQPRLPRPPPLVARPPPPQDERMRPPPTRAEQPGRPPQPSPPPGRAPAAQPASPAAVAPGGAGVQAERPKKAGPRAAPSREAPPPDERARKERRER